MKEWTLPYSSWTTGWQSLTLMKMEILKREGKKHQKKINVFSVGPTRIQWEIPVMFHYPEEEKGQESMLAYHSVSSVWLDIQHHTSGTFSRILFLRKLAIFIVLIYSGRHNNLTFFWHHLSSRASRLLCWKVISLTVLHLLLSTESICYRSWFYLAAPTHSIVPLVSLLNSRVCFPWELTLLPQYVTEFSSDTRWNYEVQKLYKWTLSFVCRGQSYKQDIR